MFAGIDCPRACLRIEHPATYINISPSLVSLSPPLPCFLKPRVKSFLLDSELCGIETDVLLHACTWALSDLEHSAGGTYHSQAGKAKPPVFIKTASLLLREPTRWINWGHGAGETSCACVAAEYFTSRSCVWKQPYENRFYFQLQPRAVALLLTGHVPIGQSQSILVACQPQMPEACPRFLSPYTMKSAGSHSLQLRKVASYAVLGRWGQVLMKASRCHCNSNNN